MYSIVKNDVVVDRIEASQEFADAHAEKMGGFATDNPEAHIGHIHNAGYYTKPPQSLMNLKARKMAEINSAYRTEREANDPRRKKRTNKHNAIRDAKTQAELDAISW